MKYVALLSGGKDSCFNLVHCHKNGHELVAAASLGPGPGKEELDSFLYQTVGQDAIEFVAGALEVPLYRRVITGGAVEQGAEYGTRNKNAREAGGVRGDETEDLYELLESVKAVHPDVQGKCCSCSRLGLTPLTYLWQRDQGELLTEMIEAGMEAILIKVAGIGLTPKHLGKTLAQMQPYLTQLNTLYGSHVCGEGGEYESLTLDCPLFKKRISLYDVETVIHSDNAFATVAYLRIKDAELQPKDNENYGAITIPSFIEDDFIVVHDRLLVEATRNEPKSSEPEFSGGEEGNITTSSSRQGNWVSVCNIQREDPKDEISLEDEVIECFAILQGDKFDLKISNCTNINILISSMDLFTNINSVYGRYFGTSPPSRACVAVDLPHPIRVRLDCTAFVEDSAMARQALHVQGLSYWAPANIGPYSQAIVAGERISISGQIGLVPSSLSLPSPPSLPMEFALSSQHISRITRALRNGWEGVTQSIIYFLDDVQNLDLVREGHKLLQLPPSPTLFVAVKALPKNALIEKQALLHTGRRQTLDDEGETVTQIEEPMMHCGEFFEATYVHILTPLI
ncbi:adenine nucleotide alpha hydrolases-like protein [Macrolepiota fuliginosa MF-IS2]|uniref:Diphthine--ammonia ligase n=1 Tax=Macrolepiota fuliginosa MF-IS2 TaxID=1400762 RepID=A0A9P6C4C9_9AGAR|nr:adenine nucleotide alpha hydrolases-like protein [Macrolepiota fuliginosa MF-IS2]